LLKEVKSLVKIVLDRNGCIGCGACTGVCPKYYEMANDGKSVLKGSQEKAKGIYELEVKEEDIDCNKDAEEACPVSVIHVKK
jgi:ferredoxin